VATNAPKQPSLNISSTPNVTIHVRVMGAPLSAKNPVFVMLHGFSHTIDYFEPVASRLIARYKGKTTVLLPGLRGTSPSTSPKDYGAYKYKALVDDIQAVIKAADQGNGVHLVGHDWGALFAWGVAYFYPAGVVSLHVINAPHPELYSKLLETDKEQTRRSRYVRMVIDESFLNAETDDEYLKQAQTNLQLNYYKANCFKLAPDHLGKGCQCGSLLDPVGVVKTPTHVIWSTADVTWNNPAVLAQLPGFAKDLRQVDRAEFMGHEIALSDPCYVARRIADLAMEIRTPTNASISDGSKNPSTSGTLSRTTLTAADAVCADGSPAVYYFRAAAPGTPEASNVLIFFEGGGDSRACTTAESCREWKTSSPHLAGATQAPEAFPKTLPASGLMSASVCENTAFNEYNVAYVPYCTADFYAADVGASSATGDAHLRGQKVFRAAIEQIMASTGATKLVCCLKLCCRRGSAVNLLLSFPFISFCSTVLRLFQVLGGAGAGGIGVMQHLDWTKTKFPTVSVSAIVDSAGALDPKAGETASVLKTFYQLQPTHPCAAPWGESNTPC
jgi:pimeloyl-ACP methyl ester carboxylesterase